MNQSEAVIALEKAKKQREKLLEENAKKRLRQDIADEVIPRRLVSIDNIWDFQLPDLDIVAGWYQFQADEILSFYLKSRRRVPMKTVLSYVKRLRKRRTKTRDDVKYNRQMGGGKISMNSLYFILECKALVIAQNSAVDSEKERLSIPDLFKHKGLYETNGSKLSQSQALVNLAILQRNWDQWIVPLNDMYNLLNYIQWTFGELIINKYEDKRIMDGVVGEEVTHITENNINFYFCSYRFIDYVANVFLGLLSSYGICETVMQKEKEFKIINWGPEMVHDERFWFDTIPKDFTEWFEEESQIVVDESFRMACFKYAMHLDLMPGESIIYKLKTDSNTEKARDESKIFQTCRPLTQFLYWQRQFNGKIKKFEIAQFKSVGKTRAWMACLILIFDSYLKSRCNFSWMEKCFYTETRFREEFDAVTSSQMPMIVKLRTSFYIHFKHGLYMCHTIDRAIYLWSYIVDFKFHGVYDDWTGKYNLKQALSSALIRWTISKRTVVPVQPPPPTSRNDPRSNTNNNVTISVNSNVIIDEDSISTHYEQI